MTTDPDRLVYTSAMHAPWREILRQRCSGRLDRALVLRDRSGEYYLLSPRRHKSASFTAGEVYSPMADSPSLFGDYEAAFHVQLGERAGIRPVAVPTAYGSESADVRVLWWVADSIQVVSRGIAYGWDAVCGDLDQRLKLLMQTRKDEGRSLGIGDMLPSLEPTQYLKGAGLAYRVTDVHARRADGELRLGQAGGESLPYSWTANHRDDYEFCLRAVQSGPLSLAALWLLKEPGQVGRVLDWSMNNQALFRGETRWQDEMAGLLGTLTPQEQQELSELLRNRLVALGRRVPGPRATGTDSGSDRTGNDGPAASRRPGPDTRGWPK